MFHVKLIHLIYYSLCDGRASRCGVNAHTKPGNNDPSRVSADVAEAIIGRPDWDEGVTDFFKDTLYSMVFL